MPPRTFDWRDDPMGTIVAVPQVRARFIVREPDKPPAAFHSHEESEAIETWVVLQGTLRLEFEDGEVLLGPGQAAIAYPHEKHRDSCVGDEPAVFYITVTPHRSPTHTNFDAEGNRLPSRPGVTNPTWQGEPAMGVHLPAGALQSAGADDPLPQTATPFQS